MAIGRVTLLGGGTRELIHVDKTFLIAAIEDARSWCHEVETPWGPGRTSGSLADYDAALAVLEAENVSAQTAATGEEAGDGN